MSILAIQYPIRHQAAGTIQYSVILINTELWSDFCYNILQFSLLELFTLQYSSLSNATNVHRCRHPPSSLQSRPATHCACARISRLPAASKTNGRHFGGAARQLRTVLSTSTPRIIMNACTQVFWDISQLPKITNNLSTEQVSQLLSSSSISSL